MAKEKTGQAAAIEAVESWYQDAEAVLLRARLAVYWRHNLPSRKRIGSWGELTQEEEKRLYRDANEQADAFEDDLIIEAARIRKEVIELGQRFKSDWLDLFYLELGNIELQGLTGGRCALVPLQELAWRVLEWGRDLVRENQKRTLNCQEVVDWQDRERWINRVVDEIRERLLRERLTLKSKPLPLVTADSEGDRRGGRDREYSNVELAKLKKAHDRFLQEYRDDSEVLKDIRLNGIRKRSIEHFVFWAKKQNIDIMSDTAEETRLLLDAHRKRFPTTRRKSKTNR